MNSKSSLVGDRFPHEFNCAQTVFSLHADELGINEKTALRIASGFGGGMACAETCGAVTGAYMVIGLKHGHHTGDAEAKAHTKQKIQLFNEKFKAVHGSLICKELTGYDISTPEGSEAATEAEVFTQKCPGFLKSACDILAGEI
ncbi:C-GCAxxG-C-C family protein [Maribellus sediminis]|uniref:C-GCAxxG-C-C family protein n=1 Tax=Maribellus sediminis TaxID=2696285 RepID=UPI0014316659|nr:C-GCAxxG-C-C family protein [Maribellus sediminis]